MDMAGNYVRGTPVGKLVGSYTPDRISPEIESFDLDMNTGFLNVSFSETIAVEKVKLPELSLQSYQSGGETVQISPVSDVRLVSNTQISIHLSDVDIRQIQGNLFIAKHSNSTYLSATPIFVEDTANVANSMKAISSTDGLRVRTLNPDTISPAILSVSINMNIGELTVAFNEPVLNISNVTNIRIQSGTNTSSAGIRNHTLSEKSALRASVPGLMEYVIKLSAEDLQVLKLTEGLASDRQTTYFSLTDSTFYDTSGNGNVAIQETSAIIAFEYTEDSSFASLVQYSVDFEMNVISLVFSDIVRASSIDVTALTILNESSFDSTGSFTLDRSSYTNSSDGYEIHVFLSAETVLSIKTICKDADSTFLLTTAKLIDDHRDVDVIAVTGPLPPVNFVSDSTSPQLEFFVYNGTDGSMTLTLSEAISVQSINASAIVLQNALVAPQVQLRLSEDTHAWVSEKLTVLVLELTEQQSLQVQSIEMLARNQSTTFVSIESSFVTDFVGNSIADTIREADNFIADSSRPQISVVTVNMDLAVLNFNLTEIVDVTRNSFNASAVTLQSSLQAPVRSLRLSNGTILESLDGSSISVQIRKKDLDLIKRMQLLFTRPNNSFVSVDGSFISDQEGNPLQPVTIGVGSFTADSTAPVVTKFSYNASFGSLRVYVSEPVKSINVSLFALHRERNGSQSMNDSVSLRGDTPQISKDDNSFYIHLSQDTINTLNSIFGLATSADTTFLTVASGAFQDMAGNQASEISYDAALQAVAFLNDTTGPQLKEFSISLDGAGYIELNFTEVVHGASLNTSAITLQSNDGLTANATNKHTLTNAVQHINLLSPTLWFVLSKTDLDTLKLRGTICTNSSNCFLSAGENGIVLVRDVFGNDMDDILPSNALQVNEFTPDKTAPIMLSFNIDFDAFELTAFFTEPMRAGSLVSTDWTIQNNLSAAAETQQVSLNYSEAIAEDGNRIVLALGAPDVNKIKSIRTLATANTTTYIVIRSPGIADMTGNELQPISSANALQCAEYAEDTVAPVVTRFEFFAGPSTVKLTFSEPIVGERVDPTALTLQSAMLVPAAGEHTLPLSAQTQIYPQGPTTWIEMNLSSEDARELQALSDFAVSNESTFLSIGAGFVQDMVNISNLPSVMQVDRFAFDNVRPEVVGFSLNMNVGMIILNFSEIVDPSTFNASRIELGRDAGDLASAIPLRGSIAEQEFSASLVVTIGQDAMYALQADAQIGKDADHTYLYVSAEAIFDMSAQAIEPILAGLQITHAAFEVDTTPPRLLKMNLDMNSSAEQLLLIFDEVVIGRSLDVTSLIFASSQDANATQYRLTDRSTASQENSTVVIVSLSFDDITELKLISNLASTINNTWLFAGSNFTYDMNGNAAQGISKLSAISASIFQEDKTRPQLTDFSINLNASRTKIHVITTYTEPIRSESVQGNLFEICGSDPEYCVILSNIENASISGITIAFFLTERDSNALKRKLQHSRTPKLRLDGSAVQDMNNNAILNMTAALNASVVVPDSLSPVLVTFAFPTASTTKLKFSLAVRILML
eukprot:m.98677 g.98677  ORF g.98677 m.98677 type:complete len:1544 (+) comp16758_c0_seq2:5192-9823(+)